MAGGDMRVQTKPVGTLGIANQVETVDANSVKAGTFTEPRTIDGNQVWLTKEGAAALDDLASAGYDLRASKDPGTFEKLLLGDFVGVKGEQFQGRTK